MAMKTSDDSRLFSAENKTAYATVMWQSSAKRSTLTTKARLSTESRASKNYFQY
jgi:hypothetical protein